jgi:hypothetical protein
MSKFWVFMLSSLPAQIFVIWLYGWLALDTIRDLPPRTTRSHRGPRGDPHTASIPHRHSQRRTPTQ